MKRCIPTVLLCYAVLSVNFLSSAQLGAPTPWGLLGKNLAESFFQNELQRIGRDMTDAESIYLKDFQRYEKNLKKLGKKHQRERAKEERIIKSLIGDMLRYTPGSPDVNRVQEEKQKRLYNKVMEFQENDRRRAKEIEHFRAKYYPKMTIL